MSSNSDKGNLHLEAVQAIKGYFDKEFYEKRYRNITEKFKDIGLHMDYGDFVRANLVQVLINNSDFSPCGVVIDLGCGFAPSISFLQKLFHQKLCYFVGIDWSSVVLQYAKSRYAKTTDLPIFFMSADINYLPFSDCSVNLVVALEVLEHVPNDRQVLQECWRVLRTGGIGVFSVPNNYPAPFSVNWIVETFFHNIKGEEDKGHLRRYSISRLSLICRAVGFRIEQVLTYGYWILGIARLAEKLDQFEKIRNVYRMFSVPALKHLINLEQFLFKYFSNSDGIMIVLRKIQ